MMHHHLITLGLIALALTPSTSSSQVGASRNATLLGRFDPSGNSYNDVWGYVAPDGREYAVLGTTRGTFIVNCSVPSNPRQVAYFSGPSSTWRDMRSYRNYVYVVTEGGGGVQIIDMADPDNPRFVKTWGQSLFSRAHNVALDTDTGMLYPCGTNNGTPILSLAEPENPVFVGRYSSAYVHDLHVQDGIAHMGEINNGRYRTVDITNPSNTRVLGSANVSSCHTAWPSRDGTVAVTTSERSGGGLTFFDISNNRLPIRLGTFKTGRSTTSVHNAYMLDRVCHASYYSEGYQSLDLSDPSNPVRVAFYDSSSSTSGYSGAWGCYPFMPSGVIYLSDMSNGLHLIDSKSTSDYYGPATAGAGGENPEIMAFGCSFSGNPNFRIDLENAPPNTPVALLIGDASSENTAVAGVNVMVDLSGQLLIVNTQTDASGNASVSIPLSDGSIPATLYSQFIVVDSGSAQGLSASRGMKWDVFAP